jgi:hypothetical protein
VTSATYDGSIDGANGLAGADSKCAALATSAGLPTGTYKAWLSTSTVDAVSRLGSARGFIRTDGSPFADQVSDITSGKILNTLNLDETGTNVTQPGNANAWTGSTNAGTAVADTTCVDWTSSSGMVQGEIGHTDGGPTMWSDESGSFSCNDGVQMHLYCFDTSHITPLTVTPVPGRVAFLSTGFFDASTGVPVADTLCQTEANAAGLANPTQFLALLSTTIASAASRFNMGAMSLPFVRPDGVKIADAPSLAAGNVLDSGIWQHADGSYLTEVDGSAWTGSSTPNAIGTDTCADWTTKSGSGVDGETATTSAPWWNFFDTSCAGARFVYCLEQ